jgi:pre-mRNA-processing factor 40
LAREQAEKASIQGMQSEPVDSQTSVSAPSVAKAPCSTDTPTSTVHGVASSPVAVVPVVAAGNIQPAMDSTTSTSPVVASSFIANADEIQTTVDAITPVAAFSGTAGDNATVITDAETMYSS